MSITFLSPNKKVTKEIGTRGRFEQMRPPCASPRRSEPNCRTKIGTFLFGTESRLRYSRDYGDVGREILKRAYLIAGAINSAPLKSASLGTFLAETRKV